MSDVRSLIRVSWERSEASQVDADHPSPAFVERGDNESVLLRAARPVLASLSAELVNEPACLILTDRHGVVLHRGGGDNSLLRALDKVQLAEGFRYGESDVGTNGIGTALEVGGPILVNGTEHYTGNLRPFSCAGALITHPVSGTLLGVIDLTTPAGNSNSLLLSFAKLAARRIQERILEEANELDGALLSGYYAACRHSGGPVIAVGQKVLMMNELTQQYYDAGDRAALLEQARDAVGRVAPYTLLSDLPSGMTARLAYQPTLVGETLAGGIIQIKEQHPSRTAATPRVPALPGLAGTSAAWRHVSQEVLDAVTRSARVVLQGEPGSGRVALITAAHRQSGRLRELVVLDAAGDSEDLVEHAAAELEDGADLVIRHAHRLSPDQVDGLALLFQELEAVPVDTGPWIALTVDEASGDEPAGLQHLQHFFPRTISVPPLRHHLEDLPALVRAVLARAGATELTLSKPAMNQLMRLPWPNNVTHLRDTLTSILRVRRSGVVDVGDLPAECLATTRRSLSRMEALERDAIVEALGLHDGDKTAAAESLGMSRATIYRKIRDYGVVA